MASNGNKPKIYRDYGVIAQLGARIKTTSKCCFYRKWRSFVSELVCDSKRNEFTKRVTEATNGSKKRLNEALGKMEIILGL